MTKQSTTAAPGRLGKLNTLGAGIGYQPNLIPDP
jgi:hypothetical protein